MLARIARLEETNAALNARLEAWEAFARSPERLYWRGSVTDLLTDLVPLLTLEQLAELAGESALAWRDRRLEGKKP
jgi:hypothetical protein